MSCTIFKLRSDLRCGYYDFRGACIVVQQSDKREPSTDNEELSKKRNDVYQKNCWTLHTNFHLLLFGVTITIIIKVGKVVAFSLSLVSAVRAKLDSCYLQRQVSISELIRKYQIQTGKNHHRWMGLTPVKISAHKVKHCDTYYRRHQ